LISLLTTKQEEGKKEEKTSALSQERAKTVDEK
jgi:hypothetical protein